MIEYQKEAIIVSFLNEKVRYKKLAEYIVHLIGDDPSSPKESLHTIIYRIKDELRIIEKIDKQNKELEAGVPPITEKNYRTRVGDLLGVRIICLRLSDIEKVEAYLGLLAEEKILRFVKGPIQKRSFILPIDPGELISDGIDLSYSGYSSIHYQVELGENSDAPSGLEGLQFEFQLRTILEEAWGEIDHKYRYVRSRSGVALPEYIHTGFYNFSAYLQVAALQAEYLCRLAERRPQKVKGYQPLFLSMIPAQLILARMLAVPNSGSTPPLQPSRLTAAANRLDTSLNVVRSVMGGVSLPAFETITAFNPFDPMTAPSPPRPAARLGFPSGSVAWIEALANIISPAGPIDKIAFF